MELFDFDTEHELMYHFPGCEIIEVIEIKMIGEFFCLGQMFIESIINEVQKNNRKTLMQAIFMKDT